ncbi:MAG: hypothetical protein KF802_06935 [Bdellovibrionaceae bacterium]|nr:hypothetical protein [Pseudobdellovibrionaceae bacterium]
MSRIFFFCGLFFLSLQAAAVGVEIYPVNHQTRFERDEEHALSAVNTRHFAAGLSAGEWAGLLEYSSYDNVSGPAYSRITRRHQELVLWGRREFPLSPAWILSGAAGLGMSREDFATRFGDQETINDNGGDAFVGAVSAGLAFEMKKTLRLSLEGRLFFGSQMDPTVQPDVVLRSGFRF